MGLIKTLENCAANLPEQNAVVGKLNGSGKSVPALII